MDWTTLTAAGAFIAGVAVGVVTTIRVTKVVAVYLTDLHKGEHSNAHDSDGRR